jgi:hypothetical protein
MAGEARNKIILAGEGAAVFGIHGVEYRTVYISLLEDVLSRHNLEKNSRAEECWLL